MSRTPLIRRLAAIAVVAVIPFGAAAASAHAETPSDQDSAVVVVQSDFSSSVGFAPVETFRSSWS